MSVDFCVCFDVLKTILLFDLRLIDFAADYLYLS